MTTFVDNPNLPLDYLATRLEEIGEILEKDCPSPELLIQATHLCAGARRLAIALQAMRSTLRPTEEHFDPLPSPPRIAAFLDIVDNVEALAIRWTFALPTKLVDPTIPETTPTQDPGPQ